MMSEQEAPACGDKTGVDLDPLLEQLGNRGRYQVTQLMLNMFASFVFAVPIMDSVFTGYQPDFQCSQIDNVTQLEDFLPNDVTNFTLYDVRYQQCSIDVTVNTSGTSSTHSLPCVAGVNFSMPSDTSFLTEWSLVCDKAGLTQLAQMGVFAGQAVGYLLFAALADRYGRKKVYVSCALCAMISLNTSALVPSYYYFLACRVIAGFFGVGIVIAAYTMFMELLHQEWRSLASVMDSTLWTLSCLFVAIVAYCLQGLSWRYLSLAISSVFVYSLFLPCFLDESLRWLVATGEMEEAKKILKKACQMNGTDFERIQAMLHKQIVAHSTVDNQVGNVFINKNAAELANKAEVTSEAVSSDGTRAGLNEGTIDVGLMDEVFTELVKHDGADQDCVSVDDAERSSNVPLKAHSQTVYAKYTVLDLFRHRVVLVPFFVCLFVWMTSNLYYYAVILGSANLSGNRFLNFGLLNLQDIPAVLLALFLERRFNRRPLAFVYGMIAAIGLLLSVGLAQLGGEGVTLTLATVAQYIGMFSLTGSYILLFIYSMEVFPTAMRAAGIGTAGTVTKITDMGAPFLVLWAEQTLWAPGVLLGCLCCLASFSIWLLPETRHRKLPDTIEEIQAWGKSRPSAPDCS